MTPEQHIAEVQRAHLFDFCNMGSIGSEDHCSCRARPRGREQWIAHVTAEIVRAEQAARRIETVEQLDALPPGSIVLDAANDVNRKGDADPGNEWCWDTLGHWDNTSARGFKLPAVVLFNPAWESA